ncbi:hypothetical protein ES703_101408 [subsurface metagenome]
MKQCYLGLQNLYLVPHPQPKVRCHLVVATPAGMKFFACLTNFLYQRRFDSHVNIFETLVELEPAFGDFALDLKQALLNLFELSFCD